MHLDKIEIHGFKSFADATTLQIPLGITGIIGPNGSGKSNIADAIRWVLGEQSARSLRGSKMEDIIFSGTDKRKSLGYAEVALTIKNSEKKLPIEYTDVCVKRRIYRSGESEYFINGSPCRLKDIQELFMDTGIGKEGYSIIGQGQIDRVLTSKPEERRALFEEAAGIYKYKVRRQEAERKLEKERDNLVRVEDIIHELETQLTPLEEEAEKTKQFLKLRDTLKVTEINLFLYEMAEIEKELGKLTQNQQVSENELGRQEYLKTNQVQKQKELKQQRETLYQNTEQKLKKIVEIEKEKTIRQNQIELNEEKISSTSKLIQQVQKESREHQERYHNQQDKINQLETSLITLEKEQVDKQTLVQEEETKLKTLETKQNQYLEQSKQLDTTYYHILREKDKLEVSTKVSQDTVQTLEQRMKQLEEQFLKLQTTIENQKVQKEELNQKQTVQKEQLEALKHQQIQLEQQRSIVYQQKTQLEDENRLIHQNKTQLERQIEWLKQLKTENEGYLNSVKQVLKIAQEDQAKWQGIIGVVGNLLEVPRPYEIAILTALGGAMQNIVTKQEKDAREMIELMKQKGIARLTFLPLDTVQRYTGIQEKNIASEEGYIGIASELVQYNPDYQSIIEMLLGRIIIVDTMQQASQIAKKYHYKYKLVTLQGEIFNPGGSLSGGSSKNQKNNVFSRSRELKQAQEKIAGLFTKDQDLKNITQQLEMIQKQYTEIEQVYQNTYANVQKTQLELEKISQSLKLNQDQYDKLLEDYHATQATKEDKLKLNVETKISLDALKETLLNHQQEQDALKAQQEITQIEYNEINKRLMTKQIQLSTVKQNINHVQAQLVEIKETANDYETKQAAYKKTVTEYQKHIETLKEEIIDIQQKLKQDDITITQIQEEQKEDLAQKSQLEQEEQALEQRLEKTNETIQLLQQECYRLKTKKENELLKKENWQNRIWEQYELTYHNALAYKNDVAITVLREQAVKLKNRMKTIGNVNINAIDRYKETKERYTFLVEQKQDIEKAADTLLKMIEQLTKEMKEIFKVQFSIIAHSFSEVFKKLFGGGEAYLELTDEEHILDSGIEIIAKPPGKKLQNMSLLSGGERTLTAISLIFGILRLKPSPFCVLDEIEAALDEANVLRFAQFLDTLSEQTQFIVITHRKGTMTHAHTLYGITQKDKGVSTVLSVQLEEAYQYTKQDKKIFGE